MEKELKDLFLQVIANQVAIYKRLEGIENQIKGGFRSASMSSYVDELYRDSEEALNQIRRKESN